MRLGKILTFSTVYRGIKVPGVQSYLGNVSTELALDFLTFASAQLHIDSNASNVQIQRELLSILLKRQSLSFQTLIYGILYNERRYNYIVFDLASILQLMSEAIQNRNTIRVIDSTPYDEYNLFMSILVINESSNIFTEAVEGTSKFERFCQLSWPRLIQETEIRLRKDLLSETYRGLKFIQFLEGDPLLKQALLDVNNTKDIQAAIRYPMHILNLYLDNGFDTTKRRFNGMFSFNLLEVWNTLENWIIDINDGANYDPNDYKTLRGKPIIRINNTKYLVSNWNFVLDKFFNGLIFDLHAQKKVSSEYPNFGVFKSKIGKDFSEEYTGAILKDMFGHNGRYYFAKGQDNSRDNQDFYLRKDRHIALIEFKDPLFKKSNDYETIKKVLDSKIVKDKGVVQLVKLIKKLSEDISTFEPQFPKGISKKINVYPLLIVSDAAFTMTGMEDYANNYMREKLKDIKLSFYLHRLILIDLSTLTSLHHQITHYNKDVFQIFRTGYERKMKVRRKSKGRAKNLNQTISQHMNFNELMIFRSTSNSHKVRKKSILNMSTDILREWGLQEE